MANEIEKAIAKEIAARSPFAAQDIYSAWENHRSFDLILAGIEYCATFGLSDLGLAITRLIKRKNEVGAWVKFCEKFGICDHERVSGDNEAVSGCKICKKCFAVATANA